MKLLIAAVRLAGELRLRSHVVTSAYWARTPRVASRCLRLLRGLDKVVISVDRHHLRRIPPERVGFALDAAREQGMERRVLVTVGDKPFETEFAAAAPSLLGRIDPEDVSIADSLPLGRARGAPSTPVPAGVYFACGGMSVPLVDTSGTLSICCAPAASKLAPKLLCRGSVARGSFRSALEESDVDYWLVQAIRAGGVDWIADQADFPMPVEWRSQSPCLRCLRAWGDPAFIAAARRTAGAPQFRETVAWLLNERGDPSPLTRHLMEDEGAN